MPWVPLSSLFSFMDKYRTESVPPRLYRTHYPGSKTSYISGDGFLAIDTKTFSSDLQRSDWWDDLLGAHLHWEKRSSPFISTYANHGHAEN